MTLLVSDRTTLSTDVSHWVECRARDRAEVRHIYEVAKKAEALNIHAFWFEPWHREGAVVRVHLPVGALFDLPHLPWDAEPDAELFDESWPWVQRFFETSTALGMMRPLPAMRNKLVHCHLNAQGLDVHEELAWALRFAWGRARMCWTDRRRLVGRLFRA